MAIGATRNSSSWDWEDSLYWSPGNICSLSLWVTCSGVLIVFVLLSLSSYHTHSCILHYSFLPSVSTPFFPPWTLPFFISLLFPLSFPPYILHLSRPRLLSFIPTFLSLTLTPSFIYFCLPTNLTYPFLSLHYLASFILSILSHRFSSFPSYLILPILSHPLHPLSSLILPILSHSLHPLHLYSPFKSTHPLSSFPSFPCFFAQWWRRYCKLYHPQEQEVRMFQVLAWLACIFRFRYSCWCHSAV